jgi:streptomycin 6-kinase
MLDRWHLTAGEAFVGGEAAAVLRVTTRDGSNAVLKVGFPHFEATHEAMALAVWASTGLAPGVLRQDPWTWSLLLEEVVPGTSLSHADPHGALDAGARLLGRLHTTAPPPGLPTLAGITERYLENVSTARAGYEGTLAELHGVDVPTLLDRGMDAAAELASSIDESALLHGDFNPGNVLAGPEGRWMAIDPKPMIGDRCFDLFPFAEQLGDVRGAPERLAAAASLIDCDPARAARWAFARCAFTVSWLLTDGERDAAKAAATEAQMWQELSAP